MSYFNPVNHPASKSEDVDFIVPERLREACILRDMDYKCAAFQCGISEQEFGAMANGHKEIPREMIFGLMKVFNMPEKYFYHVRWERR